MCIDALRQSHLISTLLGCMSCLSMPASGARPGVLQAAVPEAAAGGRGGGAEEAREGVGG